MKLFRKILVAMLLGTMAIQVVWADIFEKTKDELLIDAVEKGDLLGVKYQIVKNGANVNAKRNKYYYGVTALIVAVGNGHSEIVKYLISKGADVNATDDTDETALHIAVKKRNKEIVKLLIENGANVNAKSKYDDTPLKQAVSGNNLEIVKLLIENSADVNGKNNDGKTALYYAVANEKYEIAKYLISKGADVNAKDNDGTTILIEAARKEDNKRVSTVEQQKNTKLSHNIGIATVKTVTIAGGEVLEMVKYLVEKGADVNAKSEYSTPLINAINGSVYGSNLEIVKYLVSKGADVNLANGNGQTPLMYASEYGYLAIVKYLISKGANADIKDNKGGLTAIDYAKTDEIRKILQEQVLKGLE